MPDKLPTPNADQRAVSAKLVDLVAAEIKAHGALPFSRYMERCLYAPGLGYYSAGSRKFGEAGDFVTAPELGDVFASCVAHHMIPVIDALGVDADIWELGGGSGAFARDCLLALAREDRVPRHYYILEPSADLRERQEMLLRESLPQSLFERVVWLDKPLDEPWQGVLFANEVIDALPVTRFLKQGGEVYEEHVDLGANAKLALVDKPADTMLRQAIKHIETDIGEPFADGYRSEVLPQLPYWLDAVTGAMTRGMALFVDYGYPRSMYYLPERRTGTLRAYYQQRAHEDVFFYPGLQDLTASVDFTALAEAGQHAGFELATYNSHMQFLLAGRLQEVYAEHLGDDVDEKQRYRLAQQIKQLTLPGMMGESFQAMTFVRDMDVEIMAAELDVNSWIGRL